MMAILDAGEYRGYVIRIEVRGDSVPPFHATIRRRDSAASELGSVEADLREDLLKKARAWIDRITTKGHP